MADTAPTLLICTVGGTIEPLVQALCHWLPARLLFLPSEQTQVQIDTILREVSERTQHVPSPGAYERFPIADPDSLDECLRVMGQLDEEVRRWLRRGDDYRVVADFTAGTKCMSAALTLQARRWPCQFSYVGGGQRTKAGMGTVVSGTERIVHQANPWDALGHQAVEEFVVLFDQRAFLAAAEVAGRARSRVSRLDRRREFSVLEQLARAFDAWDRFDHKASLNFLNNVAKAANDLRAVIGSSKGDGVIDRAQRLTRHLNAVCGEASPSHHHVVDLLANAKRRWAEGRIDDAVARLYRAIEAVAQVALKERHGIESTEEVPLDRIPEDLRVTWTSRARDGVISLGLQDAYALLSSLGDAAAEKFRSNGLDGVTSPLSGRNRSILAHGFERVSGTVFDQLWKAVLEIGDIEEASLPVFPTLSEASARYSR